MPMKVLKPKRLCFLLPMFIVAFIVVGTFFHLWTIDDRKMTRRQSAIVGRSKNDHFSAFNSTNSKTEVLLDWTLFFGSPLKSSQQLAACPHLNCVLSADRSLLASSRVVIFHLAEIGLADLPKHRDPRQFYAVLSHESPANTGHVKLGELPKKFFNLTMTYRRDSSVYAPYSTFVRSSKNMTSSELAHGQKIIAGKKKLVAWFVSNCNTAGKREAYVEELKRHLPVDVYGSCGPLKCDDRATCRQMLNADYKFYLSFENSHCKDYITEKFLLLYEPDVYVVPVVLMKENYLGYAPPGSFVSADDFSSPKHLADYLRLLDSSPELYAKYFAYKSNYALSHCTPGEFCGFCRLCEIAHMGDEAPRRTVEDLDEWWRAPGGCRPSLVPQLLVGVRG